MKTLIVRLLLFVPIIIIYGCPNDVPHEMYTKVNADGSCIRELEANADSAFIAGDTSANPFPMKLDSSWKISFYKRMEGDSGQIPVWYAIASHAYGSVKEMNAGFTYDHSDWDSVRTKMNYNKSFRWFYTYFNFSETYLACNVLKSVPVSAYLNDEEIQTLYGENTELFKGKNGFEIKAFLTELNKKAEDWLDRSLFDEIYNSYAANYELFNKPPVDSATFVNMKDSVYKYYKNADSLKLLDDNLGRILNGYFKTNIYSLQNDTIEKRMENFPDFLKTSGEKVNYKLSLPGSIIETNAPFLKNDTLSWKLNDERFYFKDYKLYATSRKANIWAFVVTGLIVIFAITALFVKRRSV